MTFLPIVERELRVAARKRTTYLHRTGAAAMAVVFAVFIFLVTSGQPGVPAGLFIFLGLSGLAAFYCFFAGNFFTVHSLTDEKREGTLGLLFLTDLTGWDIVLGKLAATALNAFFGLLALLPVLAVPLMMGGVSSAQFWRVALVLVIVFLFSLAVAIFASAVCRTTQKAGNLCLGLLFLFALILPGGCALFLRWTSQLSDVAQMPLPLLYTSPFFAYVFSIDPLYRLHPVDFWFSLIVIHGLTWLLVWAAARIVPRSWQESTPAVSKTIVSTLLRRSISARELARRAAHRKKLLNINAFYWLMARDRFKPLRVWIFVILIVVGYFFGALLIGREWFVAPTAIFAVMILNSTFKLWVASEAGLRLAEDKKSGAIELILSTSITVQDFIRGQWLALRRQFLKPFIGVIAFQLLLIAITSSERHMDFPALYLFVLAGLLMLMADTVALKWVAMAQALVVRRPAEAGGQAALRVLLVPWLLFIAFSIAIGIGADFLKRSGLDPVSSLALWFGLGLVTDLFYGRAARRKLLTGFRELAAGGRAGKS